MMLAEKLKDVVAGCFLAATISLAIAPEVIAPEFNKCASQEIRARATVKDFFTNQGPRFSMFSRRTIRLARTAGSRQPS